MKDSLLLNFPDLKGKESETLYVIGNGFDLFHGLPSSYNHFYCWLINNGYNNFVKQMETIFPATTENRDKLLWKDFEEALGKFDAEDIHNRFGCKGNLMFDEEKQMQAVNAIKPTLDCIPTLMNDWAIEVSKHNSQKKLYLPKDSLYLTFNYTDVLEKTYEIPKDRITHIHLKAGKKVKVITGYGNNVSIKEPYFPNDDNKERSIGKINDELKKLQKPTDQIRNEKSIYFNSLKNITRVVFLGYSFSYIDSSYVSTIIENVSDEVHWHLSAYSTEDLQRIWEYRDRTQKAASKGDWRAHSFQNKLKRENFWIFNL